MTSEDFSKSEKLVTLPEEKVKDREQMLWE